MSQGTLLRAELPTIAEIRSAAELIYQLMPPTPQYCWPLLGERLGAEVWLKHENHTPTGAFKARTAVVYVDELMKREPGTRGLITATRGNHGQSVALAAKRFGISATIVVPYGNSREKNAAMRAQGGTLIEFGADYQAAREKAFELAAEKQLHMVQPYHYDIVRGVATYWLELFSSVKDIDVAYVPIGMGSGICSAVAVRNGLGLRTKLVGVVSAHAPSYAESFEQRKVVEAPATTRLADGMACRKPDEQALAILLENIEHIVRVTDDEVGDAMRHIFTDTHNVVEGAGAAGLAAALKEKDQWQGKRVALVATGANVDSEVFARVLQGQNA
ncbi:MAG TPA: threonine dehydratase [Candidatus Sulfotelmatobacter sp.]|nr:threonine dehydratase [Candidatus Sulfotelmatobacter sp.]